MYISGNVVSLLRGWQDCPRTINLPKLSLKHNERPNFDHQQAEVDHQRRKESSGGVVKILGIDSRHCLLVLFRRFLVSGFWKDSTRPRFELGDNSGIYGMLGKQDVRQLDFVPRTPKEVEICLSGGMYPTERACF